MDDRDEVVATQHALRRERDEHRGVAFLAFGALAACDAHPALMQLSSSGLLRRGRSLGRLLGNGLKLHSGRDEPVERARR